MALVGIPDLPDTAFQHNGDRKIKPQGGGGGPSSTTSYQTNVPEYLKDYVNTMMGAAEKQIYTTDASGKPTGFKPFQSYSQYDQKRGGTGESVAGFTPMQVQAMKGIQGYQLPGQTGQATDLAGLTALGAVQTGENYNPQAFGNYYNAPSAYKAGQFGVNDVTAGKLKQYQMDAAQNVSGPESFSPEMAKEYINPYMQNVVDIQKREAQRQADLSAAQRSGQAAQVGAFGGSRMGLENAMANRETQRLMSDIQQTGSSAAYQQGMQNALQQFNQRQQGNMQAALANQAAGMNVGQQNLAARLGVQQLGSQQSMQAQLANQSAAQQAQQMREASRQFGYGQNMNAAQLAAQYGLAGQQAEEQSRQFGSNLRMQGYGISGQQAALLGQLGQQQYGQEMGLLGQQMDVGGKQQAYEQSRLNQIIQDYATAQQYPFMQLGILNAMTRGLPMQSVNTSMYQAQPTNLQQLIGTAGTLMDMGRQKSAKEGGIIKMASGGITNPYKLAGMAKKLSDPQLESQEDDPMGVMEAEKLRRKEVRGMASGGIIAFAKGGDSDIDRKDTAWADEKPKGMFPIREDLAEGKSTDTTKKTPPAAAPVTRSRKEEKAAPQEDDFYSRYQKRIAPALADVNKVSEDEKQLTDLQKELIAKTKKSDADFIEEQKAKEKAAGLNTDFMTKLKRTYTQQLDAMADEAEDQKYLRRAQAWAIFGSTPGPLLKVGLQAMSSYINDTMEDTKARKKAMNELNKAIYEVDHAEYLVNAGRMEKADSVKADAWKRLEGLTGDLAKIRKEKQVATLRATAGGAEAALQAESGIAREKVQGGYTLAAANARSNAADKEEKSIEKQTKDARGELQKWDADKGKKLDDAKTMLSNPNFKGEGRKLFEATRDRLQAERDALKAELKRSYPNARLEEEAAAAPAAAPTGVKFLGFEK
jgi:hypothetical protein